MYVPDRIEHAQNAPATLESALTFSMSLVIFLASPCVRDLSHIMCLCADGFVPMCAIRAEH